MAKAKTAAQLEAMTPEERKAYRREISPFAQPKADPTKVDKKPKAEIAAPGPTWEDYAPTAADYAPQADPAADAYQAQFGSDMAWLDPAFEQSYLDPTTAAALFGTSADPTAQAGQQRALDGILDIGEGGGATAMERARRASARESAEGWLRGQREADMSSLSQRGLSGSGAELAALSADRQAAGQRLSSADLETDAALEQRAMDALMQGSQLSTLMRGQSDAYAGNIASALNAVGRQNADWRRSAWENSISRADDWQKFSTQQKANSANTLQNFDAAQNSAGFAQGQNIAGQDAAAKNTANTNYNQAGINNLAGAGDLTLNAFQNSQNAAAQLGGAGEDALKDIVKGVMTFGASQAAK